MTVVGAFSAKTHFSQLLSRLEAGEQRIVIQRHGRNVAVLLPYRDDVDSELAVRRQRVMTGLARIRAGAGPVNGKARLKDLVAEGHRV